MIAILPQIGCFHLPWQYRIFRPGQSSSFLATTRLLKRWLTRDPSIFASASVATTVAAIAAASLKAWAMILFEDSSGRRQRFSPQKFSTSWWSKFAWEISKVAGTVLRFDFLIHSSSGPLLHLRRVFRPPVDEYFRQQAGSCSSWRDRAFSSCMAWAASWLWKSSFHAEWPSLVCFARILALYCRPSWS